MCTDALVDQKEMVYMKASPASLGWDRQKKVPASLRKFKWALVGLDGRSADL